VTITQKTVKPNPNPCLETCFNSLLKCLEAYPKRLKEFMLLGLRALFSSA